ncbi:MAG: hypothetical protein FWH27_18790, partial [Planctomycetaceae bacterium]|nr:hypothetical protein [Planctomycetaceae bacterium]
IARTTPGKAVGFLFIPIFNFYWIFVAFRGLGKNMNETLRRYGIQYQVNEGLGGIFCILAIFSCILPGIFTWILYWVPYISFLGILVNLAVAIVLVFFFMSVKKAAIALLKQDKKGSENGGFLKSNLRQSATSADKKLRGSS